MEWIETCLIRPLIEGTKSDMQLERPSQISKKFVFLTFSLLCITMNSQAWASSISCNLVHYEKSQRAEMEFQKRLHSVGARASSQKRQEEAQTKALAWIGQIGAESKTLNELRTRNQSSQVISAIKREMVLNKTISSEQQQETASSDRGKGKGALKGDPGLGASFDFHRFSRDLFPENFDPATLNGFERFYESDLILQHIPIFWSFLAVDERLYPQNSNQLVLIQRELIAIMGEKLKTASVEKRKEYESVALDFILSYRFNTDYHFRILKAFIRIGHYGSEAIVFELLEARKNLIESDPKSREPDQVQYAQVKTYEWLIKAGCRHIDNYSEVFQRYLLAGAHQFNGWPSLLLDTPVRLIEPVNEALREKMLRSNLSEETFKIAKYFIKFNLYKADLVDFLKDLKKNPETSEQDRIKIQILQIAASAGG